MDKILSWLSFAFASVAILVSPWFFGAWEMWWFWPFTVCIFLATLFFAVRLLLRSRPFQLSAPPFPLSASRFPLPALAACLLFLLYAFMRFMQADVFMDAERSFLLFLTPFLLGVNIVLGFNHKQRDLLWQLIMMDLCLLGLYGIINHFLTGSRLVLWAPGYEQYFLDGRASGSYFCPDHFSGVMELAFCVGLGVGLTQGAPRRSKALGVLLCVIALWGVMLSKSRGGGLAILAVLAVTLITGLWQRPTSQRWHLRISACALTVIIVIPFWHSGSSYVERFKMYLPWDEISARPLRERPAALMSGLRVTSRGRMAAGALRAWRTAPVWGIGPGMHQNLWPHFAASNDGNRELETWPTLPNNTFHSYEVHNDWIQLLEEYGIVGFVLFLLPACAITGILITRLRRAALEHKNSESDQSAREHAILLTAILALSSMAFHSLGDFNLQMPATTWLLAGIIATAVGNTGDNH